MESLRSAWQSGLQERGFQFPMVGSWWWPEVASVPTRSCRVRDTQLQPGSRRRRCGRTNHLERPPTPVTPGWRGVFHPGSLVVPGGGLSRACAWACLGLFRAGLLPSVTADWGLLETLPEFGSQGQGYRGPEAACAPARHGAQVTTELMFLSVRKCAKEAGTS